MRSGLCLETGGSDNVVAADRDANVSGVREERRSLDASESPRTSFLEFLSDTFDLRYLVAPESTETVQLQESSQNLGSPRPDSCIINSPSSSTPENSHQIFQRRAHENMITSLMVCLLPRPRLLYHSVCMF